MTPTHRRIIAIGTKPGDDGGFTDIRVYAETSIRSDTADPDGEPVFRGTLITDRLRPPVYSLRVKI